jgi:uncharacterized membrane protein
MYALVVWRFDGPEAAKAALPRLEQVVRAGAARVDDAALVSWRPGVRKPATVSLGGLDGPGRLWGGFWGVLLALIFLTPIAGPTFGAAAGAVAGSLADFGVADDFVKRVRDEVGPGTSALFVVTALGSADRLDEELGALAGASIRSMLSPAQEQHFLEALGDETAPPAPAPGGSGQ